MKKMICLALIVLTILCVFTGCNSTVTTRNGYGSGGTGYNNAVNGRNGRSNVSTSRNGTVNGNNGTANEKNGTANRNRSTMPNVGMDVEIGTNVR